jgi:hypothetical protein
LAIQPGQQEFNEEQSHAAATGIATSAHTIRWAPIFAKISSPKTTAPRPAGGRDQPVEQVPDPWQIGQQIDGQHQHVTVGALAPRTTRPAPISPPKTAPLDTSPPS